MVFGVVSLKGGRLESERSFLMEDVAAEGGVVPGRGVERRNPPKLGLPEKLLGTIKRIQREGGSQDLLESLNDLLNESRG